MRTIIYLFAIFICFISCSKLDFERVNKITQPDLQNNETWITVSSTIVDISNAGITEFGHCWSETNTPTVGDSKTVNSNQISKTNFVDTLYNLLPNKTYYIRSYIKSNNQFEYGEPQVFTTSDINFDVNCESVEVTDEEEITALSTVNNLGSFIIPIYGTYIYEKGKPYEILQSYSKYQMTKKIDYSDIFTNLEKGKTYIVKAFIKLDDNTSIYSEEFEITIPILKIETTESNITGSTSAMLKGNIISLPFETITQYGFCWSTTTSSPSYNSNIITINSNQKLGLFESSLLNIIPNQTYYYRAFALYKNTVYYGDIKTFIIQ